MYALENDNENVQNCAQRCLEISTTVVQEIVHIIRTCSWEGLKWIRKLAARSRPRHCERLVPIHNLVRRSSKKRRKLHYMILDDSRGICAAISVHLKGQLMWDQSDLRSEPLTAQVQPDEAKASRLLLSDTCCVELATSTCCAFTCKDAAATTCCVSRRMQHHFCFRGRLGVAPKSSCGI